MRVTTAAVIASVAAAARGLSPSWTFASTITITDEETTWYTISTPFLTAITTDVSGTVETITTTMVSISIGTKPPSAISPTTSTSSQTIPGTASTYGPAVSAQVHKVRGIEASSPSTSTADLVTHTHSHTQSSTIDDSDVLPTTSSITSQGDPTASTLNTATVRNVATSSTTTSAITLTTTSTISSLSLGHGSGDETSSTTSSDEATTVTIITIVGQTTSTITSSATNTKSSIFNTLASTATSGSSIHTVRSLTITGFLTTSVVTDTAGSTTDTISSTSTSTSLTSRLLTSVLYYTSNTSSKTRHTSSSASSAADPPTTSKESTTFTTRTVTSTPTATDSSGFSPSTSSCRDGEPWTGPFPNPFSHPGPTDNAIRNPAWWWGHDAQPTDPPVADAEPPRPHPSLPFEYPPALHRAEWIGRLE
ncbi:hypothetical protein F4801DRAFT_603516 [Xylaria longipes]|nr:hypothetical protein F4801DRAFT_603516 [Xylaria longipes]